MNPYIGLTFFQFYMVVGTYALAHSNTCNIFIYLFIDASSFTLDSHVRPCAVR